MAQLWLVSGPNGAGKSTFVERYFNGKLPIINPDNITQKWPDIPAIRAGRLAIEIRKRYLAEGHSFVWETTLSGKRERAYLQQAQHNGYRVNLVFIGMSDPALAIARIIGRVASGGHYVPPYDVVRRFERSLKQLPSLLHLVNRAYLFDNTSERRTLLLLRKFGHTKYRSETVPDWAKEVTSNLK